MKIYHLQRKQFLPTTIQEAWSFFSNPSNLSKITPAKMKFRILYISGEDKLYAGQLIKYRITLMSGIAVNWVTEITHVNEPSRFIDEQRFGPYALWHHQHHFRKVDGGVEMVDEVSYAVPFGIMGRLANWLFVEREANAIFDHRYSVLQQLFTQRDVINEKS